MVKRSIEESAQLIGVWMSAYAATLPRSHEVLGSHPNVELDQAEGAVRWGYGRKRLPASKSDWWPTRPDRLRMRFAEGRWQPEAVEP